MRLEWSLDQLGRDINIVIIIILLFNCVYPNWSITMTKPKENGFVGNRTTQDSAVKSIFFILLFFAIEDIV